jgi:hypothetical protein
VLRDEGAGELVLTNMANWALPVIRYRTGDRATLKQGCECGYAGATLLELPARETENFRAGRDTITTREFDAVLCSQDVKQFQVTQVAPTEFAVVWIPSSTTASLDIMNEALRQRLEEAIPQATIRVRAVESITKPGGKVRRYISFSGPPAHPPDLGHQQPRVIRAALNHAVEFAGATEPLSTVIATAGRHLLKADAASGELLMESYKRFPYKLTCAALSSDASLFSAGDRSGAIHLCDTYSGMDLGQVGGDQASVTCIAFGGGAKQIVSGGADGTVNVWDALTLEQTGRVRHRGGSIACVAASLDGTLLATADAAGRIRVWDASSFRQIRSFGGKANVLCIAFTPDGDALAGGCADHSVRLWDARSGRLLAVLAGHRRAVSALRFCPDAKTLVSGSLDGTLRVWHAWSGRHLSTLQGHRGAVRSVFVTADSRTIVSGGQDGTVRLWPIRPATDY